MRTTKLLALTSAMILACAASGTLWQIADAASEGTVRTVQGEVVAVNVSDSPPVIVVKSMAGNKEMIVGATVEAGVEITRGKQRVSLDSLKVGDKVSVTYVKTLDGLAAQSIHAR